MTILINNNGSGNKSWLRELKQLLPKDSFVSFKDNYDAQDIEFALVWNHPTNDLIRYKNLKGIMVLGAGTDHLDSEAQLPNVPIARLIDPTIIKDMSHYVLYWVLHSQRLFGRYQQQQQHSLWKPLKVNASQHLQASILGLGEIGLSIAKYLSHNYLTVNGWSSSQKSIENIHCYQGKGQLKLMLNKTDVLINCLPLTEQTYQLLNKETLEQLPQGSCFINIGRGATVKDDDLISLLVSEHIAAAALDVFPIEPLPEDSPYWSMNNVHITPHVSGTTYARSAAAILVDNINRIRANQPPSHPHIAPCQQHFFNNN